MTKKINEQFLLLQAIGIILVVLGHKGGVYLFTDWFPEYSFHMPLFIFISGYFYKKSSEVNVKKFIIKKAKSLLIPYFIWNLVYGIFVNILKYFNIVEFAESISIKSLFIEPWISGYQFVFNISAWFVLCLFIIQIVYILIRVVLKKLKLDNEYVIMMILIGLGLLGVILSNKGYTLGWQLTVVRCMFLIPFYQMGYIYKIKLEEKDNISNTIYFIGLFMVQFILIKRYGKLTFSAVFCNEFNHENILLPYLTSITGIMFWLRISRILVPSIKDSKIVNYIGSNTWTIMMHHYFGFFVVNIIFATLSPILGLEGFNYDEFRINISYTYVPGNENIRIFYMMAGIGIPLIIKYYLDKFKRLYLNTKILEYRKESI